MISERYDVGDVIGAGAFATVYQALDPRLDSPVAIKVLAENWSADPAVCERFGREAMLLRRVRSDRRAAPLVEVFDIDQTADGRPFFVMSFADRGTLAERWSDGHPWSDTAVRDVVETLADGLHALHAAGIVHRDIKPSNLLYAGQADAPGGEQLLIGDLGLAKDLLTDASELTIAGGTPGYMAPEQQLPAVSVTPGADIYSASVIVCELASGQRGLSGQDQLPPDLRAEVQRGTATDPAHRHPSIMAWRDAMVAGLGTTQVTPMPPTSPPVAGEDAGNGQRSRGPLLLAAAAVLIVVAIISVMTLGGGSSDVAITGPETAEVGETVFLRADVPPGGSHVWTVDGTQVVDLDLRLTPQAPGNVFVQLDHTAADGATTRVDHQIVVTDGG